MKIAKNSAIMASIVIGFFNSRWSAINTLRILAAWKNGIDSNDGNYFIWDNYWVYSP